MSESGFVTRMPEGLPTLPSGRERENNHPGAPGFEQKTAAQAAAPWTLWQRVFSFPAMLGAVLVGAMATIAGRFFVDPDVWWHIQQGSFILSTRHVPTKDIFSLTLTGHPWTAYEWLGDVLLAATYRLGGMRGLEAQDLILGSAILIALYTLCAIRSGNSKAAFVATGTVFLLASVSFNLRPQMLGYLFLILTLIVLERFRQGHRRTVWLLPILMLLWVNSHGSWIIGIGIVGVYLVGGLLEFRIGDMEGRRWNPRDRLRLASAFGLCLCATVVTPYGATLARYPFDVAFSLPLGVANVIEWQPMPFNLLAGKLFLVLLLGCIVLQVIYRFEWRLEEFALFLFATAVACLHVRFLLIFVPLFAMRLSTILARWVPSFERAKDRPILNAAFMGFLLWTVVHYFPSRADLVKIVGKTYPVDAVEYLNHNSVPGPMYNTYGFGGYLILARGPEHKVFMDGRSELYERGGVLAEYVEVVNVRAGALSILRKYGFQSCLLNRDEPLATFLAALPDWRKTYEDGTSVLFVHRGAGSNEEAPSASARLNSGNGL